VSGQTNASDEGETAMKHELSKDDAYARWLRDLKDRVHSAQLKAAVRVNSALLEFYWELGRDILEKQRQARWGDGFSRSQAPLGNAIPGALLSSGGHACEPASLALRSPWIEAELRNRHSQAELGNEWNLRPALPDRVALRRSLFLGARF